MSKINNNQERKNTMKRGHIFNIEDNDLVKLGYMMLQYIKDVDHNEVNHNLYLAMDNVKRLYFERFYEVYGDLLKDYRLKVDYAESKVTIIGLPYYTMSEMVDDVGLATNQKGKELI